VISILSGCNGQPTTWRAPVDTLLIGVELALTAIDDFKFKGE